MKIDAEARAALEELVALWRRDSVPCCPGELSALLLRMESAPSTCQTCGKPAKVVAFCGDCAGDWDEWTCQACGTKTRAPVCPCLFEGGYA